MPLPSWSMKVNKISSGVEDTEDCSYDWTVGNFFTTIIQLCSISLNRVIDISFEETQKVSSHRWINKTTPSISTEIWSREAGRITLLIRVDSDDKYALELCAGRMSFVIFNDYGTLYSVWIHRITATYDAKKSWAYPWLLEIELIINS